MFNTFTFLSKLVKHRYTALVIIAGSFAFLSVGGSSGWGTPSFEYLASPESPIPMTSDQHSWVASMIGIGGPIASIPCSYFLNKVGRKPVILTACCCYLIGWIALIFASEVVHLYLGRFFVGMGLGSTYCAIPLYIGEVVDAEIRGKVLTFILMCNSIGVIVSLSISSIVTYETLTRFSIYAPSLMLLAFLIVPESPYFLMKNDKKDEATACMMKLKGCTRVEEVETDMKNIQKFLDESENSSFLESLKELTEPRQTKAVIIVSVLLVAQQISGLMPICMFMGMIFSDVGLMISTSYATIIAEVLSGISALICSVLIDRFGRKTLFGISSSLCIFGHFVLGLFYTLKSLGVIGNESSLIVLVAVIIFRIGYEFGLSSVPSVVMSEVLSFNVRGIVGAYFAFIQGIMIMIATKLYQIITDNIGQQYFHWIFLSGLILSTLFILYYMPETKNKLFIDIQNDLDNKKNWKKSKKDNVIYTIDSYKVKDVI